MPRFLNICVKAVSFSETFERHLIIWAHKSKTICMITHREVVVFWVKQPITLLCIITKE